MIYRFCWRNNPVRAALYGRLCRIVATGAKQTVLIEMVDTGEKLTTSRRALRRHND